MEDIVQVLGLNRQVVIAREVTKLHEEFLRGRAGELLERLRERGEIKGEITLLIGKSEDSIQSAAAKVGVRSRLKQIMTDEQVDEKAALKKVAKELGVSKSEAYRELQRSK
jgi:16S rRNA (cytidine1402-2'-O)-methyltransferase